MSLPKVHAELQAQKADTVRWLSQHTVRTVDDVVQLMSVVGRLQGVEVALQVIEDILKEDDDAAGD